MNTATAGKTATRFDVPYDVMEASNSMGEGGSFAMRDGKAYHFKDGVAWEGMGFPFSAGLIQKTGETDGLPCFHWRHPSYTEMVGVFNGTKIYLSLWMPSHSMRVHIGEEQNYYFDVPCSIQADGFIWPDSMYDLEHKIVDILS